MSDVHAVVCQNNHSECTHTWFPTTHTWCPTTRRFNQYNLNVFKKYIVGVFFHVELYPCFIFDFSEWPRAVWRLLTNGIFLLASLSFITEGALVYSLAAFFPKYMQVEFGLDVSMANLTAGI